MPPQHKYLRFAAARALPTSFTKQPHNHLNRTYQVVPVAAPPAPPPRPPHGGVGGGGGGDSGDDDNEEESDGAMGHGGLRGLSSRLLLAAHTISGMQRRLVLLFTASFLCLVLAFGSPSPALAGMGMGMGMMGMVGLLLITPGPYAPSYSTKDMLLSPEEEEELFTGGGGALPINEYQLLGTHNSCHRLNLLGYNRTQRRWEVSHDAVDPLTVTPQSLIQTLSIIRNWSDAQPSHFPLVINLDIKGQYNKWLTYLSPLLLGRGLNANTHTPFEALIDEVEQTWPQDKIFAPADLIAGKAVQVPSGKRGGSTLHETVAQHGWPTVASMRGKAMFQLNLYGANSVCCRAVPPGSMFWVRGGSEHDRRTTVRQSRRECVYFEPSKPELARALTDRNMMVRMPVLANGPLHDRHDGAARLQSLTNHGVQLIATNHPAALGTRAVRRMPKSPPRVEEER